MEYSGKLIIFTSFYKHETIAPYCESLVATSVILEKLGIRWDYWPSKGDFHIERSINDALTRFAMDDEATDFINIDSDEAWSPMAILRMIKMSEPIVSGSYRVTNAWDKFTGVYRTGDGVPLGKMIAENEALLEADRVPGGFLRIKKEVVKRYIDAYPEEYFLVQDRKVWPFFWNEIKNHEFIGMDYALSDKLIALGYQLWIDPLLEIDHYGLTKHSGTLDKFLRDQKAASDDSKPA